MSRSSPRSSTCRWRSSARSPRPASRCVGENRAQDLEAKATAYPQFRWHFIGQLQSRKVKQIVPYVELIHSVATDPRCASLERHATPQILLEVNVAGEEGKAGIAPDELPALPRALARCRSAGLMTMPPFADDPEDSRPYFAALARAGGRARPARAVDGHLAGLRGRGRGGRDDRAHRHDPLRVELCRCRETAVRANTPRPWPCATRWQSRSSTSASPRTATTTRTSRATS